jgi:hypothetical protein
VLLRYGFAYAKIIFIKNRIKLLEPVEWELWTTCKATIPIGESVGATADVEAIRNRMSKAFSDVPVPAGRALSYFTEVLFGGELAEQGLFGGIRQPAYGVNELYADVVRGIVTSNQFVPSPRTVRRIC